MAETNISEDSEEFLEALLATTLGVPGLGRWAAQRAAEGYSENWIVQAVRYGLDTSDEGQEARRAYLTAFPGMDEFLANKTFYGADPEGQYLAYKESVQDAARRYGISDSLATPQKIYQYLTNGVNADEIVSRMSTAAQAVATTPVETRRVLEEYYGVTNGDLISFFLDPEETEALLQQRYTAARIGTEAVRNKFGLSVSEAESLAQRGVTATEAQTGFETAAARRAFMGGAGETAAEKEIVGASFGDVEAEQKIARIAGSRAGRFAEGGGFATDQGGISGLASTTR